MFKKVSISALLLLQISPAVSGTLPSPYISAVAKYTWLKSDHRLTQRSRPSNKQTAVDSTQAFAYAIRPGILWMQPSLMTALELFYNQESSHHEFLGVTTKTRKEMIRAYGGQLKIGPRLNSSLSAYGLVGISYGRFLFEAKGSRNNTVNHYNEPGGRVGAGLTVAINSRASCFIEYIYTKYRDHQNISGNRGFYERDGRFITQSVGLGGTIQIA